MSRRRSRVNQGSQSEEAPFAGLLFGLSPGEKMQGGASCSPSQRGDGKRPYDGPAVLVADIQKNAYSRERADNRRTNAAAVIEDFARTTEHVMAL